MLLATDTYVCNDRSYRPRPLLLLQIAGALAVISSSNPGRGIKYKLHTYDGRTDVVYNILGHVEISVRGVAHRCCTGSPCKRVSTSAFTVVFKGQKDRTSTTRNRRRGRGRNVDLKIKKPITCENDMTRKILYKH